MRSDGALGRRRWLDWLLVALAAAWGCGDDAAHTAADAAFPAAHDGGGCDACAPSDAGATVTGPSCDDGERNGDETGVDCGGACGACEPASDGGMPDGGGGAIDGSDPACDDGEQNGDETGIDCGGDCDPCPVDPPDDAGPEPSCDDGVRNGDETTPDCGGDCPACDSTGDFRLSPTEGSVPVQVRAITGAIPGNGGIVEVRYDWGDGTGTSTTPVHTYRSGGSYVVTQSVRDEGGGVRLTQHEITLEGFRPVRMNPDDVSRHPNLAGDEESNIVISPDRMAIEVLGSAAAGVRSDGSIAPQSGVFYFEGERLIERQGFIAFGVATAAADLEQDMGTSPESFGVFARGGITTQHAPCRGITGPVSIAEDENRHYGFVVDYRGTSPIVHVIASRFGVPTVECSAALGVTQPLFMLYSGLRSEVGYQARINSGADIENFPFHYGREHLAAALAAVDEQATADALVLGFGASRALERDGAPQLTTSGDVSVPLGQSVTLTAAASDPEEGDLSDKIEWTDRASLHSAPDHGYGSSFTFTPRLLGKHPVAVQVTDDYGVSTTVTQIVTVTGSLPQFDPVRMIRDERTGEGAFPTADGLSVYFEAVPDHFKDALRANQGLYGDFWYFEAHRHGPKVGIGIGLTVDDGTLNPYGSSALPWSMSINLFTSVWHNLISVGDYDSDFADYGFAVDYRGESPIVYLIVNGALAYTLEMPEVTVPLYPMAYGGREDLGSEAAPIVTFDFTPPFQFDPAAALNAAGIDSSGLELGWGDANTGG